MATKTKKKKPSAFMKPVNVSPELAKVVGKGPMPRTEITQNLWDYIKKNGRQDPKNKRKIRPDANLAAIFGTQESVDMFEMTRLVNKHVS